MSALSTGAVLGLTVGCVGTLLLCLAVVLRRRGLFHWTSMGFWAWAAFGLYFVANPLAYWLGGDLGRYEVRLALAGGSARGLWILLVTLLGIITFFISYLRSSASPVAWNLHAGQRQFTPLMLHIMLLVGLFSFYSLVVYRANLVDVERTIVDGRFVGETTGYQNTGYTFWFVPAVMLLLANSRAARASGWLTIALFIILALPRGWARFAIVSIVLAASMAVTLRSGRRWPSPVLLAGLLLLASVLQIRGHADWSLSEVGQGLAANASQLPARNIEVLASSDTAMLASWYLWSYLDDNVTGYDYGLPAINYTLLGWIPSRFLPQKYFLIDWLRANQGPIPASAQRLLRGSKATLLGDFYGNGGVLAVIVLAALAGLALRKIDGMLRRDNPTLVQATGIAWLSMMWIIWGSTLTWALVRIGSMSLPVLLLWFFAPKQDSPPGNSRPVASVSQKAADGARSDWPTALLQASSENEAQVMKPSPSMRSWPWTK